MAPDPRDLERLFELSLDLFCVASFDGYFLVMNPAWERVLGYPRAELMGRPFVELVHPDDRERTAAETARLTEGGHTFFFENRYLARDGGWRWLRWKSTSSLELRRIYAVARDVTDEKRVEEELRAARELEEARMRDDLRRSQELLVRSERLRSLGQLAAGIAHDLKNVLVNPLALQLQLAERALGRGDLERAAQALPMMRESLRQGVEAIDRLRQFSRDSPARKVERLDASQLAERADMARARIRSSHARTTTVVLELGPSAPISGDAAEIVSALVNLIVNAIEALAASGGTVRVRTGASDGAGFIEVADDGPGMALEVQSQAFDAFYTTKGEEGTGLGLAMVRDCVTRHGGSVELDTAPGRGARFRLTFPPAG